MKKTIARLANELGYAVLPKWRMDNLPIATRLRKIFSFYRIDAVIDVGANEGQYRDFLRLEVGFDGRIDSFEPLPGLAEHLIQRAAREDAKWTIHACALGAEVGAMSINIMRGSVLNSFHKPVVTGKASLDAKNIVIGTMTVPVSTLDSEFSGGDLGRTYLKLDTQGFDLEVLRGGTQAVSHIPALQTEVSFQPLYEQMPDYRTSITAFESHGFSVADFFLVSADNMHRAMEFDCVMVRPKDATPT